MINADFKLNADDIAFYKKTGFLKLRKFFTPESINYMAGLCKPAVSKPASNYGSGFSRLKYDIGNDDDQILDLCSNKIFSETMKALTDEDLFFTQGLGFELEKNKSTGFPWHVGTQSFGFQRLEDYGCTIWTPLCNIDSAGQRGGMAYVPKDRLSGGFIYQHINLVTDLLKEKQGKGQDLSFTDFNKIKNDVLNTGGFKEILDQNGIEDDFEIGDALIFDKFVLHRSIPLGEGSNPSRLAYALRFSSVDARYDAYRVHQLEYPRSIFDYHVASNFNDDVCQQDGQKVFESSYFDGSRERRRLSI